MSINVKSKKCDFTFALSNLTQALRIIDELPDFDTYAYIRHEPDDENGSDHYHFYIHLKQPISLSNLAEKLDIPPNMIEWVRNKTKLIQYLIHKNQPKKKQYDPSDIITNNREYINIFLNPPSHSCNLSNELHDLTEVANGLATPFAYIEQHSDSISQLPFYSRTIFLMRLIKLGKEGYEQHLKRYPG